MEAKYWTASERFPVYCQEGNQLGSKGCLGTTDAHSYGTSLCQQSDVVSKLPDVTAWLMNSSFALCLASDTFT